MNGCIHGSAAAQMNEYDQWVYECPECYKSTVPTESKALAFVLWNQWRLREQVDANRQTLEDLRAMLVGIQSFIRARYTSGACRDCGHEHGKDENEPGICCCGCHSEE